MIQKSETKDGASRAPGEAQLADVKGNDVTGENRGPVGSETAKDRAATVVLAYREVDWEGVVDGDHDAVGKLVDACDLFHC